MMQLRYSVSQRTLTRATLVVVMVIMLTVVAGRTQTQVVRATGSSLPSSCALGSLFVKTGTNAGVYYCSPADTWVEVGGGGGGGGTWGSITGTLSDQTDLQSALDGKVPTSRTVSTTAPLSGGGSLSADRTLSVAVATTTAVGVVELATDGESAANLAVQANDTRLSNARTPTAHASTHITGGSDVIATVTSSAAGLAPASGGGTTNFLRADGSWAPPPGAAWGSITGTLSNQTDLQSALDGKAPTTRTISTTAPLSGGGDLSADRTLSVATATTTSVGVVELATDGESAANLAVQANDSRLSNARTPTAHASTHQHGGSDEIATATAAANAIPKAGAGGTLASGWLPAATTTAIGAVELATDGESASGLAVQANDGRLSNARTPTAHASTHVTGGSDTIATFTSSATGLVPASGGGTTNFLRADGSWVAPGAGASYLRTSSDQSSTSTTFADVTGLTLSVTSGQTREIECELYYTTAATTTALQLALNGPTTSALRYAVMTWTSATATHAAVQTAYDTNTNPSTGGGTTPLPVRLTGSMVFSASGTLAVRFRSEVSASSVTVLAGSWCVVF